MALSRQDIAVPGNPAHAARQAALSGKSVRRSGRAGSRGQALAGLAFLAPCLLLVVVFFIIPLAMMIWMSFHEWPLLGQVSFSGLQNYGELWADKRFWQSVWFTMKYAAILTILIFLVAFPLALMVQRQRPGVTVMRTVFFLPVSIGMATAATLWVLIINPDVGVAGPLFQSLSLADGPIQFLRSASSALWTVIVMVVWKSVGFSMILLMTGLQNVPSDIYEAARIDGAGRFRIFRSMTLPLMRKTTALALILCVSGAMQAFDQFFFITQGGPRNQTVTAVYSIYVTSFSSYRLGYGAAMSVVLLAILVLLGIIQYVALRNKEA